MDGEEAALRQPGLDIGADPAGQAIELDAGPAEPPAARGLVRTGEPRREAARAGLDARLAALAPDRDRQAIRDDQQTRQGSPPILRNPM
jgi:hypothetical protein